MASKCLSHKAASTCVTSQLSTATNELPRAPSQDLVTKRSCVVHKDITQIVLQEMQKLLENFPLNIQKCN